MPNDHVVAEWGAQTYPAVINGYGIAVIMAGTLPLSDEPKHHDLARYADDGGSVHE